jgi:hypothetical protein
MILFGGGDGGGFYIGPDGKIHRIPPWTPDVMSELKAVNALSTASQRLGNAPLGKEMFSLAERVSSTVIPQIAKSVHGGLAADQSVAFIDADDGFVCGSTGRHPLPFPIPHGPSVRGVEAGVAKLSGAGVGV